MHFIKIFWIAARRWYVMDASRLSAAFAYFTPFALVPLIVISMTIVGRITDSELFAELLQSWGEALGVGATELIAGAVQAFNPAEAYYGVPLIAVVFLALMVIFTFNNLGSGFRTLWGVPNRGWRGGIESAIRSIIFFLLIQVFFVTLFVIEIVLPHTIEGAAVPAVQRVALFAATVALFTFGYQILSWRAPTFLARVAGALLVAVIFIFMRSIVGWWLYFTPAIEQYGTAGIVFGLLVWIYITAMVIYYGAAYAWAVDEVRTNRAIG